MREPTALNEGVAHTLLADGARSADPARGTPIVVVAPTVTQGLGVGMGQDIENGLRAVYEAAVVAPTFTCSHARATGSTQDLLYDAMYAAGDGRSARRAPVREPDPAFSFASCGWSTTTRTCSADPAKCCLAPFKQTRMEVSGAGFRPSAWAELLMRKIGGRSPNAMVFSPDGTMLVAVLPEEPDDAVECSLSEIMLPHASVPRRYFTTPRGARGILRRADKKKRRLHPGLRAGLERLASRAPLDMTPAARRAMYAARAAMTKRKASNGRREAKLRMPPPSAGRTTDERRPT